MPYITHSPFEPSMKMGRITESVAERNDFVTFVVVRCEHCKYTAYFDYEAIKMEINDANTTE